MADLITTGGKDILTAIIVAAANPPKWGMWGTGSGQTAASTALATAAAPTTVNAQAASSYVQATTTTTDDTMRAVVTITAGGTLAITEFALTTHGTIASGTMSYYHDFSAINVVSGDSIEFTHSAKLS